ncbi:MAG: 50S ribosomal protein L16 [Vampirovibrionales bacterium]|jgi:large subunit ribosomal protein L16|nr:50S ribosomal protein L16 [Vampirovibrionales bacterium]
MLMPKRSKYRKQHRGRMTGIETRGTQLEYGDFAIQAMEPGWITSRQIEAARRTIARAVKRGGKIYIRIFPNKPVTKKPLEVRMGSGKGSPEFWVAVVKPGRLMFELAGVQEELSTKALKLAAQKFPIKVRVVKRDQLSKAVT